MFIGSRVKGLKFRVKDLGFRVLGFGLEAFKGLYRAYLQVLTRPNSTANFEWSLMGSLV